MYSSQQVRKVHLEITTKCSVRCPQCSRTWLGDTNPTLPQVELSLADIERIFPSSFVRQLTELHICGNYGDATAAQDTVEAMRYFRAINPDMILQIMTHGSARSVDWWKDLALLGVRVHFGIDGLQDTNHIYRRDTNWKMIMRNATAFIAAGGHAIWTFIVFAHNEHQVEEARKLSEDMRFAAFVVKQTGRFVLRPKQDIFDRSGRVVGQLSAPQNPAYRNDRVDRVDPARMNEYWDTTNIFCKANNSLSVFVSAEGLVTPCCYLGAIHPRYENKHYGQVKKLMDNDPSTISALKHSIAEVIDGPFFQTLIPKGWKIGPDRIKICSHMCGSNDYVGAQTERRKENSILERAGKPLVGEPV